MIFTHPVDGDAWILLYNQYVSGRCYHLRTAVLFARRLHSPMAQWRRILTLLGERTPLERYLFAGALISIIGFLQYRLLYAALSFETMRAGKAWLLHFMLGTIWSHAIHRRFTFHNTHQRSYVSSLLATCGVYTLRVCVEINSQI